MPALFFGCAKGGPERTSHRNIPANYVEGSFVLTAESTTSQGKLESLTSGAGDKLGCKVNKPEKINWGDSSLDSSGVLSEQLQNTFNVRFENCDFSRDGTAAIMAELSGDTAILSVEAEALAAASPIIENDPRKGEQGHLPFIRRDEACKLADKSGEPVIVAVVDSGVDIDHPDLKDMFLRDAQGQIVGANFVGSGSSMPSDKNFDDGNGHGTHVAGLIAATANNGEGGVGVASCANIKIMPIRVLGDSGSGSSIEIERGVKWAADHGAHIINMSLGYTMTTSFEPSFYRSLYADLASKDVIVFAAAGNDGYVNGDEADDGSGRQWHFPSSYDFVVSVAATNNYGSLTSFSNRGKRVDIAAPGYNVLATIKTGGYGRMSGTSMASPVAAGAYALALSVGRQGLASGLDRVDQKIADDMLLKATLDDASLPFADVGAAGVIDTEKLVKAMRAKYPKPTQPNNPPPPPTEPTQPTEPEQPEQPEQPIVQPKPMAFAGLSNGQKAGWPQALKVANLPKDTYAVYFYWGKSYWSFSKVYVTAGATEAQDKSRWYLYGDRTLKAVAYDKDWNVVGRVSVDLKGW